MACFLLFALFLFYPFSFRRETARKIFDLVRVEEVQGFQKEMDTANVDYQFVAYAGAVHAFTEPHVGTDIKTGAAYNEKADKRSFIAMENFMKEVNSK